MITINTDKQAASGELQEDSVISILETTATDGKTYQTKHYNLDAIVEGE